MVIFKFRGLKKWFRYFTIVLIVILALSDIASAQSKSFTGTWILTKRVSIAGPDYVNGVPRLLKVIQLRESILIQSITLDNKGNDYSIFDTLPFIGRPFMTVRPGNKRRISVVEWINNNTDLKINVTYFIPGSETVVDYKISEIWALSKDSPTLVVERSKLGRYTMKGVYAIVEDGRLTSNPDSLTGVKFESALSWQQIIQKARKLNKNIFVDCFATWCAPCKEMDLNVYNNPEVGNYMTKRFISVKVQLDSTSNDNINVRKWYRFSHEFANKYKVGVLPTFLFFSPGGVILHSDFGSKAPEEFISMVNDALSPSKQYFGLIRKWRNRSLGFENYQNLIISAEAHGDKRLSNKIARSYLVSYLETLDGKSFFMKENLLLVGNYREIISLNDPIFIKYFIYHKKIDSIVGIPGYATQLIKYIIYMNAILPKIILSKEHGKIPNWDIIYKYIEGKYGSLIADIGILDAKVKWFRDKQNWKMYAKYLVKYVQALDTSEIPRTNYLFLNSCAMDVFQYSTDRFELSNALAWCNIAISRSESDLLSAIIDTKANILYKMGLTKEAINLEERAIYLNEENAKSEHRDPGNGFNDTLLKMKSGLPTWTLN